MAQSQKFLIRDTCSVLGRMSIYHWPDFYSGCFCLSGMDVGFRGSQRNDNLPRNGSQSDLLIGRPSTWFKSKYYPKFVELMSSS